MTLVNYDAILAVLATAPNDDREFEAWLDFIADYQKKKAAKLAALPGTDRKRANLKPV